jgi:hypothetical protein
MWNVLKKLGYLAALAAFPAAAFAETVTLQCVQNTIGARAPAEGGAAANPNTAMTITYSGDASGTLTLKGAFGDMSLPATKQIRRGSVEGFNGGKEYSAIGIQGGGPATVTMPDKAAVEACVTGKPVPEGLSAEDNVFMALMQCTADAPPGKAKVPIAASVEIAFVSTAPPALELMTTHMKQTYSEASTLPGGKITIESDPRCEIVKN